MQSGERRAEHGDGRCGDVFESTSCIIRQISSNADLNIIIILLCM